MKDLIIIGAGDFGRETAWVVERINAMQPTWNLLGFIDDGMAAQGKDIDGYPVLGTTAFLAAYPHTIYEVCSIGTGWIRRTVTERILQNQTVRPAAPLVDPTAVVGRSTQVEDGCIVCAGTVLTVNCRLRNHTIINLNCTIGHDTVLGPCCTVHPGCNLSGKVHIGACTDIGTGTKIIQGLRIAERVTLGAGAVVTRDITEHGTYVGVPARRIR